MDILVPWARRRSLTVLLESLGELRSIGSFLLIQTLRPTRTSHHLKDWTSLPFEEASSASAPWHQNHWEYSHESTTLPGDFSLSSSRAGDLSRLNSVRPSRYRWGVLGSRCRPSWLPGPEVKRLTSLTADHPQFVLVRGGQVNGPGGDGRAEVARVGDVQVSQHRRTTDSERRVTLNLNDVQRVEVGDKQHRLPINSPWKHSRYSSFCMLLATCMMAMGKLWEEAANTAEARDTSFLSRNSAVDINNNTSYEGYGHIEWDDS
ncbi:hypothetical protein EYF80_012217 [Liparis tanakae]|uniref:Uncharacterized protein n=1 Tax=Liparis tanakae TaxID=230148 RepID=A0A4Z2IIL1_9TELE|nr:hypothetical protein EYF80_012217 [Liparis tanakae]